MRINEFQETRNPWKLISEETFLVKIGNKNNKSFIMEYLSKLMMMMMMMMMKKMIMMLLLTMVLMMMPMMMMPVVIMGNVAAN